MEKIFFYLCLISLIFPSNSVLPEESIEEFLEKSMKKLIIEDIQGSKPKIPDSDVSIDEYSIISKFNGIIHKYNFEENSKFLALLSIDKIYRVKQDVSTSQSLFLMKAKSGSYLDPNFSETDFYLRSYYEHDSQNYTKYLKCSFLTEYTGDINCYMHMGNIEPSSKDNLYILPYGFPLHLADNENEEGNLFAVKIDVGNLRSNIKLVKNNQFSEEGEEYEKEDEKQEEKEKGKEDEKQEEKEKGKEEEKQKEKEKEEEKQKEKEKEEEKQKEKEKEDEKQEEKEKGKEEEKQEEKEKGKEEEKQKEKEKEKEEEKQKEKEKEEEKQKEKEEEKQEEKEKEKEKEKEEEKQKEKEKEEEKQK